ncbi:MAG: molybdenum cofactor biosynthesis protein MoaE [Verrucomicrobiota bacterium]|jgi:molybdopterin synthase catalytic subunit
METFVHITDRPITEHPFPSIPGGAAGAWIQFHGIVRPEESGRVITALDYEAYPPMAETQIRQIVADLATRWPCLAVRVVHRIGIVPVGEAAIVVTVAARHRAEAFGLLAEFMDRLKQDVPIWKRRALEQEQTETRTPS